MAFYRAYFLDADGHIVAVHPFDADADALALGAAQRLLSETNFPGMELWELSRRVAVLDRKEAGPH